MYPKQLFLTFFVVIFSLCGPCCGDEPEKLTQLRGSWIKAQAKDVEPIRQSYLAQLKVLQEELTKDARLEDAVLVRNEIKRAKSSTLFQDPADTTDQPVDELPFLDIALKHWDEAKGAMEKNDQIYIKTLNKMKEGFAKSGDLDSALVIAKEIESVSGESSGLTSAIAAGEIDPNLPKTKRQLEAYLENTDWKTDGGGLRFRSDGKMFMPWHPCLWVVEDKRTVKMVHPSNAWKHTLIFSDDMAGITVLHGRGPNAMWKGEFAKRLTEEEIAAEVERLKKKD